MRSRCRTRICIGQPFGPPETIERGDQANVNNPRSHLVSVLLIDVVLDCFCTRLLKVLRGYLHQVRDSGLVALGASNSLENQNLPR